MKSTMCFVEEKTSCVCADILVDWNSCLCWTLWIKNSRWVLSHFMWTVISLLKRNFLIIENLPYIAGITANKWVEFSISSLSLLFGLVNCITLSNSFYSTNWFYFPSVSTMLDNKALRPFFAILSKWNLAKNFNYNNLKKFYYWAVSYYFVILKKYKYFQLQYSRKRLYFEAVSDYFAILEKYMYLSKTTGLYSIILSQAGPFFLYGVLPRWLQCKINLPTCISLIQMLGWKIILLEINFTWKIIYSSYKQVSFAPNFNIITIKLTIIQLTSSFFQFPFQYFPTGCLGNLLNKLHTTPKFLVGRNSLCNKFNDFSLSYFSFWDNECLWEFPCSLIRNSHHSNI